MQDVRILQQVVLSAQKGKLQLPYSVTCNRKSSKKAMKATGDEIGDTCTR